MHNAELLSLFYSILILSYTMLQEIKLKILCTSEGIHLKIIAIPSLKNDFEVLEESKKAGPN